MKHFKILDDDRVYFPEDPEMRIFGSVEKLAQWRHKRIGPAYYKLGRRIAYSGTDLNAWAESLRVDPQNPLGK